MNNFSYSRPLITARAIDTVIADHHSRYIAGGTNLLDLMKYNLVTAKQLVDINHLDKFRNFERLEDGSVRMGALATNATTAYHPLIEEFFPLLSKAILAGASAQIRNMATNGGNLLQRTRCYYFYDAATPCNKRNPGSGCSAIKGYNRIMAILGTSEDCIAVGPSDMCIALAALSAVINVSGATGDRQIAFTDFHRLPGNTPNIDTNLQHGELITSIDLPLNNFSRNFSYLKLCDRNSYAFALVSVATGLEFEGDMIKDAAIALGGVAHKPWRVKKAEESLLNKHATKENFAAAADILLAGASGYGDNNFKISLAKKAIVRNCMMAIDPGSQQPGAQPSA